MPSLAVFDFDSNTIRFVDGKPVANDVAIALGYSDPAKTVSTKVDKENRTVTKIQTVDGKRRTVTVLDLTTETAKQMRDRLSKQLEREIKDAELIRDWYPHKRLIQYDTVTRTAAGVMSTARSRGQRMTPSEAIDHGFLLTYGFEDYKPTPVVFDENIKEARARIAGSSGQRLIK